MVVCVLFHLCHRLDLAQVEHHTKDKQPRNHRVHLMRLVMKRAWDQDEVSKVKDEVSVCVKVCGCICALCTCENVGISEYLRVPSSR